MPSYIRRRTPDADRDSVPPTASLFRSLAPGAVLVRTHGGLGNQLFQVFYARLLASQRDGTLFRVHDDGYRNRPAQSPALGGFTTPVPPFLRLLSALRVPKLLSRAGVKRCEHISLGCIYLDGYFQEVSDYLRFSNADIRRQLGVLRHECQVHTPSRSQSDIPGETLIHLRLGDFFQSESEEFRHASARLDNIPTGATVISNRDDLFSEPPLSDQIRTSACHYVPTAHLTSEALLRFMSRFRRIRSNNSTLALWAALLGGAGLTLADARLRLIHDRLSEADRS